jgi:16S rRNA processing protein RimM
VAVAEIARPHGVRGELRLKIYSGDPTLLQRRPPIQLRDADGKLSAARIAAARHADKALLVQIEGVTDRDAADRLRGKEILVERTEFAPLEEGEFYACDIEGARAVLVTGEPVGTVTGLGSYPTCDVLLIDREGGRIEVPILPQFVESVDAAAKLVKLVTVDGFM